MIYLQSSMKCHCGTESSSAGRNLPNDEIPRRARNDAKI